MADSTDFFLFNVNSMSHNLVCILFVQLPWVGDCDKCGSVLTISTTAKTIEEIYGFFALIDLVPQKTSSEFLGHFLISD